MKKNIESEFENYQIYLSTYFPLSNLTKNISNEVVSNLFDKTLTLSKIANCIKEVEGINYYSELIEYNLNNLLYFLPLNEKVSINVSIRNCSEAIIKMIYAIQFSPGDFTKTGYRTLKDDRSSLDFYSGENKNLLDNIFNIYSRRSNNLHLKVVKDGELTSVLESKLSKKVDFSEFKEILVDINNCLNIVLEILCFYNVSLSTQQKLIIKKYISNKWKVRIYNIK